MSVAGFNICLSCGDQVFLTVHYVTEHLERRHNILASAPVLAANMFANSDAYQEVTIILKEFDEKTAVIEHMEKNKMATLLILSQKDLRIEALTKELIVIEKLSVSASAEKARLNWEKIVVDQELDNLKKQGFLTAVKMSKLSGEKMISDQKVEEQRKKVCDLKSKHVSLVKEVDNFSKITESMNIKMKALETKVKNVQEIEAENAKLKFCVEAQQTQLRSVTKSVEAVKCQVLVERKSLKTKIENLTAELLGTKGELHKKNNILEAKQNQIEDLQKQFHNLETANDILFIETSNQPTQDQLEDLQKQILRLEIALEKKDVDFQKKWEILAMEKDKVMEKTRQYFDEDRLCVEVNMHVKEKELEDLKCKLSNACNQADLLKSDLKKHQKNLLEHLQEITKAMQVIRNLDGSSNAGILNLSEKVLDTLVKTLVAEDQNFDGRAEGLHEYLCKKNSDLSRNEENNNTF